MRNKKLALLLAVAVSIAQIGTTVPLMASEAVEEAVAAEEPEAFEVEDVAEDSTEDSTDEVGSTESSGDTREEIFTEENEESAAEDENAVSFTDGSGDTYAAPAGTVLESGNCGTENAEGDFSQDVKWELYDNGTLYVSGNGAMASWYPLGDHMSRENQSKIKRVEIAEGVQNISANAFSGEYGTVLGLESVVISEGVTTIGDRAFYECTNLKEVTFPSTLTEIGKEAFGSEAWDFEACSLSGTLDLSNTKVKSIGKAAFSYCKGLTAVKLPSTLTTIGDKAFYYCEASVNLSDTNVISIGDDAFSACELTDNNFPSTLTTIGDGAFTSCSNLKEVDLSNTNITSIGKSAFARCLNLRSVIWPSSVKTVEACTFLSCGRLASVIFEGTVTSIGDGAFSGCDSLANIDIPEGLQDIGKNAFSSCRVLSSIHIPSSVTSIGEAAFANTPLTSIVVPAGVTEIKAETFSACYYLTNVELQGQITSIGAEAFKYCKFTSIALPDSLTTIGNYAFSESSLTEITIPENVTKIGNNAFENSQITEISIPENVTTVGEYAFSRCEDLRTAVFSGKLTTIPYGAFQYSNNLQTVKLTENIDTIDTDAFTGCSGLESVYVPNISANIAYKAFGYNIAGTAYDYFTLIGKAGSTAETYAANNGFRFHNVDDTLVYVANAEATCISYGNIAYYHCNVCGGNFKDNLGTQAVSDVSTNRTWHTLTKVPYQDATCQATGNKSYFHCSVCGKNFWDSQARTVADDVTIPKKDHSYGSYVQIPATVFSAEIEKKTCRWCGKTVETTYGEKLVPRLEVNASSVSMSVKQSTTAIYAYGFAEGDYLKAVTSSKPAVVRVSNVKADGTFKLTAKKKGSAAITITLASGKTKKIKIKVQKGKIKTTEMSYSGSSSITLKKGKTKLLNVTVRPFTSQEKISYKSSNTKVATVNSKGLIKAKKKGAAAIIVKSGKVSVMFKVKVK